MTLPDRIPIRHSFRIMPHPVAIDNVAPYPLCDPQHSSIDMLRHAAQQAGRRCSETLWPVGPDQLKIGADPPRSDDNRLRTIGELADRDPRTLLPPLNT